LDDVADLQKVVALFVATFLAVQAVRKLWDFLEPKVNQD
jgi:hypothetical protein